MHWIFSGSPLKGHCEFMKTALTASTSSFVTSKKWLSTRETAKIQLKIIWCFLKLGSMEKALTEVNLFPFNTFNWHVGNDRRIESQIVDQLRFEWPVRLVWLIEQKQPAGYLWDANMRLIFLSRLVGFTLALGNPGDQREGFHYWFNLRRTYRGQEEEKGCQEKDGSQVD